MNYKESEKLGKLFSELYESILNHFEFMFNEMLKEGKVTEEDKKPIMFVAKIIYDDYKRMVRKHFESQEKKDEYKKYLEERWTSF